MEAALGWERKAAFLLFPKTGTMKAKNQWQTAACSGSIQQLPACLRSHSHRGTIPRRLGLYYSCLSFSLFPSAR